MVTKRRERSGDVGTPENQAEGQAENALGCPRNARSEVSAIVTYTVRLWLGSRKEVISAEVSVRLSLADDCLRN